MSSTLKRINRDINGLPAQCNAKLGEDGYTWTADIQGPEKSPYEGGTFRLSGSFPIDYPFKPPTVHFETKIHHPNIDDKHGIICLEIFADWQPTFTLLFQSICTLLSTPNFDDGIGADVQKDKKQYKKNYEKKARDWTKQHAKN